MSFPGTVSSLSTLAIVIYCLLDIMLLQGQLFLGQCAVVNTEEDWSQDSHSELFQTTAHPRFLFTNGPPVLSQRTRTNTVLPAEVSPTHDWEQTGAKMGKVRNLVYN